MHVLLTRVEALVIAGREKSEHSENQDRQGGGEDGARPVLARPARLSRAQALAQGVEVRHEPAEQKPDPDDEISEHPPDFAAKFTASREQENREQRKHDRDEAHRAQEGSHRQRTDSTAVFASKRKLPISTAK